MKYLIYRILGNDLPPRHDSEQTLRNLRFILENEETFQDTEKRFLLNRIVDEDKLKAIKAMLDDFGFKYDEIPFDWAEYRALRTREYRIRYFTNVNPARNRCLQLAATSVYDPDVVLPLDGGTFIRRDGWGALDTTALMHPDDGFFAMPTWRLTKYEEAIDCDIAPVVREEYKFSGGQTVVSTRECSLVFTRNADACFNEGLTYADVDKVELLWRLGIPGVWERWEHAKQSRALQTKSSFYGQVKHAGFVCRLPSGDAEGDFDNMTRGQHRAKGLQHFLEFLNGKATE